MRARRRHHGGGHAIGARQGLFGTLPAMQTDHERADVRVARADGVDHPGGDARHDAPARSVVKIAALAAERGEDGVLHAPAQRRDRGGNVPERAGRVGTHALARGAGHGAGHLANFGIRGRISPLPSTITSGRFPIASARRSAPAEPAREHHRLVAVHVHHGMQVADALKQVQRHRVGPGPGRKANRLIRAAALQKLDDHRAGGVLDLKTAHVHRVDLVHVERIEPRGLVMVVGAVIRHEGPLPVGLDKAVAAAVLHRTVLDQHGNPLGRQALAHEVAKGARADGAEQHRGLPQRVGDRERVERAAPERHPLPVHDHILRRARQPVDVDHHVGARHANEQQLSHGCPPCGSPLTP